MKWLLPVAPRGVTYTSHLMIEVESRQSFMRSLQRERDKLHRHDSDHVAHWKAVAHPLRFPLGEGPIQYCTTDPLVKTAMFPLACSHRPSSSLRHDSAASLPTSRPQMMYLFVKCSAQPPMFSLVRETGIGHARDGVRRTQNRY